MEGNWRSWIIVALAVVALGVVYVVSTTKQSQTAIACTPVPIAKNTEGTQGYRIWAGETLISFEHDGSAVCVPQGWEALGARQTGDGWATFDPILTGVIIKSDSFTTKTLRPSASDYVVTLIYPVATPSADIQAYESMVTNAFDRTGALYGDNTSHERRYHTVLVTAGLAGDTIRDGTRVYPDPGPLLTLIVRTPNQTRSEELVIHAVGHLYNRHRPDLARFSEQQEPLSAEDWQELESTWAESAFTTSNSGRKGRLDYLLNVHTAVMTKNFSLIQYPPFDDALAFKKIVPTIFLQPNASYLDDQYGHYVLAPLAMVAVDGLLLKEKKNVTVQSLLHDVHVGKIDSFFVELKKILSKTDYASLDSWIHGSGRIPADLIYAAENSYTTKN